MTEKIAAALAKLDVTNDDHWTADGQPKIEALRLLGGDFTLKRDDVVKTAPNFSRSHPTLDPIDQGVVTPTPIVPVETSDASPNLDQGTRDSTSQAESELEGSDLDAQLARARRRLDYATSEKAQADAFHREAEKEVDRLIDAGAKSAQSDSFHDALTQHWKTKEALTEGKVEQMKRLRDANINLRDLVPQVRSPLDQSIAIINAQKRRAGG